MAPTCDDLAGMFDHALLLPTLTDAVMRDGCRQCRDYGVASVCVRPCFVAESVALLAGSPVLTGTVIGFPHGGNHPAVKLAEARRALADGAAELDMVVNLGKVLGGDWDAVKDEIRVVADLTHEHGGLLKVIFETCWLEDAHKIRLCEICAAAGADFVKTSTGFGPAGATVADVRLLRTHSPASVQVKAAGGIRTLDQVLELRAAGAARIGASATFAILDACRVRGG